MKNLPPKYPLVWDEKNPQSVIQAINENFLHILSNTTTVTTFDPIAWSDVGRERQLHLRGNTDGVADTRDNGAILTIGASYDGVEKGYDVRGLTFPDGAHALTITDHVGSYLGGTPGQLQVNLSYPTMTAETSIDSADLVAIYDSSAAAHRKITRANFVSGLASSAHTHPASDITSGQLALAVGGTGADLSATGGTGQFLRQSSAGAAITVSAIAHADLGSGGGTGTKYLRDDMTWQTLSNDHGTLTGLADDDHTQYALLAGRNSGQQLAGGTGSGEDLTLLSTTHANPGSIYLGRNSGNGALEILANYTALGDLNAGVQLFNSQGNSVWLNAVQGSYPCGIGVLVGATYRKAVAVIAGTAPILKLMPTHGVVGIGTSGDTPARMLEVRSTSAQVRGSYNASAYFELESPSTGGLQVKSSVTNVATQRHFVSVNSSTNMPQLTLTDNTAVGRLDIFHNSGTGSTYYTNYGGGSHYLGAGTGGGSAFTGGVVLGYLSSVGELVTGGVVGPGVSTTHGLNVLAGSSASQKLVFAYYNATAWYSALEVSSVASGYSNLLLMKSGGTVGIGITGTPARALEVRSTSAQQRWSYDASNYAEVTVDSAGHLKIGHSGSQIAIGGGTTAVGGITSVKLGYDVGTTGDYGIAVGRLASAGIGAVGIGKAANPSGNYAIAIGYEASCTGGYGVAVGIGAACLANYSVAIGIYASVSASNTFVSGSSSYPISDVFFGKGMIHATPLAWTLNGTGGSGTNIAGGALQIAGGKGTGNAAGGSVKIQASTAGASGTTLQTLATVAEFGPATIGFYGVTPVTRPTAYTQTYSTADRTLGAYTADNESAAYTGIDNAQPGSVYAQLTDLNALRTAYENLRAFVEDIAQMLNSVTDDLQSVGLLQ